MLFGAFDRHNLGDLLLPHIVAALLRARGLTAAPVFAGLAVRDLRACGGHAVQAIRAVLDAPQAGPATVIHVGGEVLTCDAWRAAVMLLPPAEVPATLAYFAQHGAERAAWVRRTLGVDTAAPYVLARAAWPQVERVLFNAVGGVAFERCDPPLRDAVGAALRSADRVGVRDRTTQVKLAAAGIAAALLPDPAVLVAELLGASIRARGAQGEVAALRAAFPQGYVAVQFSAEFGDDGTLAALAAQLDRVAVATGLGLVLFRAGAAPWHDDADAYARLCARLRAGAARILASLHLEDLCALIAYSRGYCGSSLHGRIVALAFARPRLTLQPPGPDDAADKQAAFAATWDPPPVPATVAVADLAAGVAQALAVDPALLAQRADATAQACRQGFDALCAGWA